jgi:hypothetical protein
VDNLRTSQLLYLSSAGIPALRRDLSKTDNVAAAANINIDNLSSDDDGLEPEND